MFPHQTASFLTGVVLAPGYSPLYAWELFQGRHGKKNAECKWSWASCRCRTLALYTYKLVAWLTRILHCVVGALCLLKITLTGCVCNNLENSSQGFATSTEEQKVKGLHHHPVWSNVCVFRVQQHGASCYNVYSVTMKQYCKCLSMTIQNQPDQKTSLAS